MLARRLGSRGLQVSALGLGTMGMSPLGGQAWPYGRPDPAEARATLERALELGISFFDTAEAYGPQLNERLVGEVLRSRHQPFVIATKFGFTFNAEGRIAGVDSRPEHLTAVCDASLQRLGVETIDLFYQHRVDPQVPIEETVGAMARLIDTGKVRYLGLSEASPATLRRAHAIHPISALQSEYSLWERGVEREVLPTCRELGIGFVPFSPLGRGFLSGAVPPAEQLGGDDSRRLHPRFQGTNYQRNHERLATLTAIAAQHDATPAQIALAWLLHQGDDIVPIPGTKRRRYLEQNVAAASLRLSAEQLSALDAAFPVGGTAGERYPAAFMKWIDRSPA